MPLFPNTTHRLIAVSGEEWSAVLEYQGVSKKSNVPADMVFFRFNIEGVAVLLNNYNCRLKFGDYVNGKAQWYYEVNSAAVRKIKKALESAVQTPID